MPSSSPNQIQQTIADCLSVVANSDSTASRVNALQTLSTLTKVSSHNRTLLARSPHAIAAVVDLSVSDSPPAVPNLSLSILFNLSLNPALKHPLAARLDLLQYLNSLVLSPPSPHAAKLAASLVCSLAMHDRNKAAFGVAGTVEAIVEAVEGADAEPITHHLLSSLSELAKFRGNATLAVRAGAVPVLIRMLSDQSEFAGPASGILGLLAGTEEGIAAVRAADGAVAVMVEGMREGCMATKENASDVLLQLFRESEECVREAAGRPEFSSLLADVAIRGSVKAREKAGELMRIVVEANLDCYLEGNPWFLD